MKKIVLISIKPKWVREIFEGNKDYEYRRVSPNLETPYLVVFYASQPIQKVVGDAKITKEINGDIESVIRKTIDDTPHEKKDLRNYFEGNDKASALRVKNAREYENYKDLLTKPPMNFKYVEKHL